MVHGKKRIPYWIDRRLNGLAGPDYDAAISFGLPHEPEDSQYGKYRVRPCKPLCQRQSCGMSFPASNICTLTLMVIIPSLLASQDNRDLG